MEKLEKGQWELLRCWGPGPGKKAGRDGWDGDMEVKEGSNKSLQLL